MSAVESSVHKFNYKPDLLLPYNWKYWQSLNLVVGHQTDYKEKLAELNLVLVPQQHNTS